MYRIFGVGILIFCFGLSSVNVSLATEVIDVPPVIVQPYDMGGLNRQVLEMDRENQEEAVAVQAQAEKNQKLADAALAHSENAMLEKINRIMVDSQRVSNYDELINLTEDVDDMKDAEKAAEPNVEPKMDAIDEKYKVLTDFENEMSALNKKLEDKEANENANENAEKVNYQQEDRIQILTQRLDELDQKIVSYDATVEEKNQEIAQLRGSVVQHENQMDQRARDLKAKDDSIRWLNQVLAVAKNKAEYYQVTSQKDDLAMQQIQTQVAQKQQQVDLLKDELENKITNEKVLMGQVQGGQEAKQEADTLKQQLMAQQDKADQLKQQLAIKTSQADQMGLMVDEYQKKLESRDNAYNAQLGQALSTKNYKSQMEMQIADLNTRLQEKEAQVIKIKEAMYDLQKLNDAKDVESQSKDLSVIVMQQRVTRLKAELALARRQKPNGVSSSDELNFLRAAYKQTSAELEQKDNLLHETKANADEYEKEFKKQTGEFQSLKEQLQDAKAEIERKNEALRSKELQILRLESLPVANEEGLKERLRSANLEIRDLREQLNKLRSPSKRDALAEKLAQALNKMDEQGRMITVLTQKLQDCGQSVASH